MRLKLRKILVLRALPGWVEMRLEIMSRRRQCVANDKVSFACLGGQICDVLDNVREDDNVRIITKKMRAKEKESIREEE
jgi:hypothetical protein